MMTVVESKKGADVFLYLPLLALCVDLFTPYLIWKHIIPAQIRWISDVLIAAAMLIAVLRMLAFKRIPGAAWLFLGVVILWAYIAVGYGQGLASTLWGIWRLIQFPFIALFVYLGLDAWPGFPAVFRKYGLGLLAVQAGFQLVQYFSGMTPSDNLAGLFGPHGTGPAIMFTLLICSYYFGYWITTKKWRGLLIALVLSTIISVLGEIKFFPLAIALIGLAAAVLYIGRNRAPGKTILAFALLAVVLVSFTGLYNRLVPGAQATPVQTYITDPARLLNYLNFSESEYRGTQRYTNMGRFLRVQVGWNSIRSDPLKLLFGYGIGARGESRSLGTTGVALLAGSEGLTVGSSLLVIMQEMGMLGLLLLASFLLWIILALAHDIRSHPGSPATGLRYGLLLFTIMWPAWLFYSTVWNMRVSMLLYWLAIGYVLAEARTGRMDVKDQPTGLVAAEA